MKKFIVFILVILCQNLSAQIRIDGGDPLLDTLFNRRVKSLDEFFARFNGDENNPEIPQNAQESRENNILALFNRDMLLNDLSKDDVKTELFKNISEFIQNVCKNNLKLKINDTLFFAEAKLIAKFQGKEKKINVILQMEDKGDDIFCWTIKGINGLIENKILDTAVTYGIRPVDNEVNFIQMRGFINSPENKITNYRSTKSILDPLSYFFALVNTKQIQVTQCENLAYHSFSVNGYYFKIELFNRKDFNSGWLISDFKSIDEKEKSVKIKKIFDK